MTVFKKRWHSRLFTFVIPRLEVAHRDLTRIAGLLRDVSTGDIWTELPSDNAKLVGAGFSVEGWRVHFKGEFQGLNDFETNFGIDLQNFEPQLRTGLQGYLASIPNINTVFTSVLSNYKDADGNLISKKLTQADRNTLAAAIEAELEV